MRLFEACSQHVSDGHNHAPRPGRPDPCV